MEPAVQPAFSFNLTSLAIDAAVAGAGVLLTRQLRQPLNQRLAAGLSAGTLWPGEEIGFAQRAKGSMEPAVQPAFSFNLTSLAIDAAVAGAGVLLGQQLTVC
jgi:predicted transcriptional regulator